MDVALARWVGGTDNENNADSTPTLLDHFQSLRRAFDACVTKFRPQKKATQTEADFHAECLKLFASDSVPPGAKLSSAARLWAASGCNKFVKTEAGDKGQGANLPTSWAHYKTVVLKNKTTYEAVAELLQLHAAASLLHPNEEAVKAEITTKLLPALKAAGGGSALEKKVQQAREQLFKTYSSGSDAMPLQYLNKCIKATGLASQMSHEIVGGPGRAVDDCNMPLILLVNLCTKPNDRWTGEKASPSFLA